jgi:hypothetical protein
VLSVDENDLLSLLAAHELAIARLYEACGEAFPGKRDLWRGLAVEEHGHAETLGRLRSDPDVVRWSLHESGLRSQAVRSSIGYVDDQLRRVQEGAVGVLRALSIVKDLEDALVEKQFFKLDPNTFPQSASTLEAFLADIARHRMIIAEAIEQERR